jgi:hypothetical protein
VSSPVFAGTPKPMSKREREARGDAGTVSDAWRDMAPDFVRTVAADRLKALGHPDRLRIVEVLVGVSMNVSELAARRACRGRRCHDTCESLPTPRSCTARAMGPRALRARRS